MELEPLRSTINWVVVEVVAWFSGHCYNSRGGEDQKSLKGLHDSGWTKANVLIIARYVYIYNLEDSFATYLVRN